VLRGILPEDLCQIFHTPTPIHAQKNGVTARLAGETDLSNYHPTYYFGDWLNNWRWNWKLSGY